MINMTHAFVVVKVTLLNQSTHGSALPRDHITLPTTYGEHVDCHSQALDQHMYAVGMNVTRSDVKRLPYLLTDRSASMTLV